jgi:hypothetical protein
MLFGFPPDLSHFRVFGCRCFFHVPKELRNKLQPKSREAKFVGYDMLSRCYRVLPLDDPTKVVLTRDVVFDEKAMVKESMSKESSDAVQVTQTIVNVPAAPPAAPVLQDQRPLPRRSPRIPVPREFSAGTMVISLIRICVFKKTQLLSVISQWWNSRMVNQAV